MSEESNQRERAQRVDGWCKRAVIVTGHRVKREREADEEMKELMTLEGVSSVAWKSQKRQNRVRVTE